MICRLRRWLWRMRLWPLLWGIKCYTELVSWGWADEREAIQLKMKLGKTDRGELKEFRVMVDFWEFKSADC